MECRGHRGRGGELTRRDRTWTLGGTARTTKGGGGEDAGAQSPGLARRPQRPGILIGESPPESRALGNRARCCRGRKGDRPERVAR